MPQRESGIAALEDVFGEFFRRQVVRLHEGEFRSGLLVLALVEQDASLLEMQYAGHARRRVAEPVGRQEFGAVRRLHLQGAEHFVCVRQGPVGHRLEQDPRLLVQPFVVEAERLLPGPRIPDRGGLQPGGEKRHGKKGGHQCFQSHHLILFPN